MFFDEYYYGFTGKQQLKVKGVEFNLVNLAPDGSLVFALCGQIESVVLLNYVIVACNIIINLL